MIRVSACVLSLSVFSVAQAQDTLVVQQPAAGTAAISISTGGNTFSFANRRRADNFSLGSASSIETIKFWGGGESSAGQLSNINGFQLTIYGNASGAPGAVLADITVPLASTNATPNGLLVGLLNATMFEFTADLSTAIDLAAGDYFFSVAGNINAPVNAVNEAFQWAGSVPGDGVLFTDRFDGNGYTDASTSSRTNYAFEFIGIPTPGAAVLLGLSGLGAIRRRR